MFSARISLIQLSTLLFPRLSVLKRLESSLVQPYPLLPYLEIMVIIGKCLHMHFWLNLKVFWSKILDKWNPERNNNLLKERVSGTAGLRHKSWAYLISWDSFWGMNGSQGAPKSHSLKTLKSFHLKHSVNLSQSLPPTPSFFFNLPFTDELILCLYKPIRSSYSLLFGNSVTVAQLLPPLEWPSVKSPSPQDTVALPIHEFYLTLLQALLPHYTNSLSSIPRFPSISWPFCPSVFGSVIFNLFHFMKHIN